jgi:DNA polymerase I-like protein with 3'-5' exonuclease and polymerase domains
MAVASLTKVSEDLLEQYETERRRKNKEYKLNGGKGPGWRATQKHSLKVLAPFFLGVEPFYEDPNTHNNPEYAKLDVKYTAALIEFFEAKLRQEELWGFYQEKLMVWQRMTLEAELDGIQINLATLAELQAKAEAGVLDSLKKLRAAWSKVEEEYEYKQRKTIEEDYATKKAIAVAKLKPDKTEALTAEKQAKTSARYNELKAKALAKLEPFNYASPSQLLWALRDVLGYPVEDMEGEEGTGAEVLELLAPTRPDIKALLDYRANYKLAHSYFPSYRETAINGRIHCSFNLNGARTGRLSCSDPNLMQVPPVLKTVFEAAEGNMLISQDLSAIEPVLIAYFTEDENLCRILINGEDFHGWAAVVFNLVKCEAKDVKKLAPEVRYGAKQADLSILYGSGKRMLFTTLLKNGVTKLADGTNITELETAQMIKSFRAYFQGAWEFKQMLDAEASGGNYIENILGRRYKIENPEDIYMKNFNRLVQGSASDLLLQGAQDFYKEMKEMGIWVRPRLWVHDNFVAECREQDVMYVNERLCHHLTKFKLGTRHGNIPLKVEGSYAKTWKG